MLWNMWNSRAFVYCYVCFSIHQLFLCHALLSAEVGRSQLTLIMHELMVVLLQDGPLITIQPSSYTTIGANEATGLPWV